MASEDSVPDPGVTTTNALVHTGLLSVGLSNLFWKGSEIDSENLDFLLITAMALFCLALPFQALYILVSRMIREYGSGAVIVPNSILRLATICEIISYSAGILGFCLMLMRTSVKLGVVLFSSSLIVLILTRSAMLQAEKIEARVSG